MLTPNLLKVRYGHEPADWDELRRHVDVRFVQKIIDFDTETVQSIPFRAKLCELEDFPANEESEDIFIQNKRIQMNPICPDWEDFDGDSLFLKGTRSSHKQKRIEF
jgi:hypothetical protein